MHEQAITEKILRVVLAKAAEHGVKRINTIKLAVGELSGIVPDSVEAFFSLLAKGTPAEDANLEFSHVKAKLYCPSCEHEFDKRVGDFNCPDCGSLARLGGTGQELTIESIEGE